MTELQKPHEPRKEVESPDLEGKISFTDGSPKGVKCGYCGTSITEVQTPVIRKFMEKIGATEKPYHDYCATEYAEDLRWLNMSEKEKAELLLKARSSIARTESDLERYTREAEAVKTTPLREAAMIALYAAVPVLCVSYARKHRKDIPFHYSGDKYVIDAFFDIMYTLCVGISMYEPQVGSLALAIGTALVKAVCIGVLREEVREAPVARARISSHSLQEKQERLAELERKIAQYDGRGSGASEK